MGQENTKVCSKCGKEKPLIEFYKHKKSKDGRRRQCKSCTRKAKRHWEDRNRAKVNSYHRKQNAKTHRKLYRRNWRLMDEYGITIDDYERMLVDQNGKCAICGTTDPGAAYFHVDHNHETGKIRGLLCNNCNPGLGWFKDDIGNLLSAAQYLRKHNEK